MDHESRGRTIALALLAIVAMAAVGFFAYNAGWQHGAVANAKVIAPPPGVPYAPYGYYGWHPWGFGFFFPVLFFIFFWFFAIRLLFWGGRGRWHRCDHVHENVKQQP